MSWRRRRKITWRRSWYWCECSNYVDAVGYVSSLNLLFIFSSLFVFFLSSFLFSWKMKLGFLSSATLNLILIKTLIYFFSFPTSFFLSFFLFLTLSSLFFTRSCGANLPYHRSIPVRNALMHNSFAINFSTELDLFFTRSCYDSVLFILFYDSRI